MSSLQNSFLAAEAALIKALEEKRLAIDDATGKGAATESIVEERLIRPHLPPHMRCCKGSVVESLAPNAHSPAIDRVVYDESAASPLVFDSSHSVFPIEAVAGLVEITIRLDAAKLGEDVARMASIKAMQTRCFVESIQGSTTKAQRVRRDCLSPRSFIVGLPADPSWDTQRIADTLRHIQLRIGSPTHVHGLYVIGRGYFETVPVESPDEPLFRIAGWTGDDRLFRFSTSFRQAFDRWPRLPAGVSADLHDYVPGSGRVLAQ